MLEKGKEQLGGLEIAGALAYSSKGSTAATTVNFSGEFPCVAVEQGCRDSLGNFRRH